MSNDTGSAKFFGSDGSELLYQLMYVNKIMLLVEMYGVE